MRPVSPTTQPEPQETHSSPDVKPSFEELYLGVWRVLILKETKLSVSRFRWENISSAFPFLRRALHDMCTISPDLFARRILAELWFALEGPLSLYLTNRLFSLIQQKILVGPRAGAKAYDLYKAVLLRVACSAFSAYMRVASDRDRVAFASRIKHAYEARLYQAQLGSDLDNDGPTAEAGNVSKCLERVISMARSAISFILHIRFFIRALGTGLRNGGPIFLALCILPPLIRHVLSSDIWTKAYFVDAVNKFYVRKFALQKFTSDDLKQEVMAGGVTTHLTSEYRKAQAGLGGTPDTSAEELYSQKRELLSDVLRTLGDDAPTLFFAFLALMNPSKLSMTQLAVLNQASASMSYTLFSMAIDIDLWPSNFSRMKSVYAVLDAKNKMKDGETPFPRPGYEESDGMSIEVRDVSFCYPNSKAQRNSLSNISFTIQPGQLVVIVGTNGSGKSTIIKLLSRLYDVTVGSILIDGIPIGEYKISELRKGIAMLTQEHNLYPLSLKESITLGAADPEAMNDQEKVEESVSAAGAEGIVKNLSSGYDTVLEPVSLGYISFAGRGIDALEKMRTDLKKPSSVSGGEKQKLVAARTFMRLFTSRIKLVAVDEPSSALDPEAEYRLFSNLRQERKGRTMIMVTHRFGHLTKHADLILCIKDGVLVETGTHADLMSRGGEYARLYNIQAEAFGSA